MIQIYELSNTNYNMNGDSVLLPMVAKLSAQINSAWTATLTHPIDDMGRWKYIKEGAVLKMPSFNGEQLFRIKSVSKTDTEITATAEPIFMDSMGDCFLVDVRPTDKTGQQALDIMTAPNGKYSGESNISTVNTAYYQDKNLIEAINGDDENSFINRWGGEIEFDNFTVKINYRLGEDRGVELRYGKNIPVDGFAYETDISEIVTRIYPKAYNGHKMSGNGYVDSLLIDNYPTVHATAVTFSDVKMREDAGDDDEENGVIICDNQAELDAALKQRCIDQFSTGIDQPKVTINADMVLLANTEQYKDYQMLETVSLGDTIHCINNHLGIRYDARVIALTYDSVLKRVESVTIGDAEYNYFNNLTSGVSVATANAATAASNAQAAANTADTAAKGANDAAQAANDAAGNAQTAAGNANTAADNANKATTAANQAAQAANDAAEAAGTATGDASAATEAAKQAAQAANTAAGAANSAAQGANTAKDAANTAADQAAAAAGQATAAASAANTAADNANNKASAANTAANSANSAAAAANKAKQDADTAADSANAAAEQANTAAGAANSAATNAANATKNANNAAAAATTAAGTANTAATNANDKASAASTAATAANNAAKAANDAASTAKSAAGTANNAASAAASAADNAMEATRNANNAAGDANTAATHADWATENANDAADSANSAAINAISATNTAQNSASDAQEATRNANSAATAANNAAKAANDAISGNKFTFSGGVTGEDGTHRMATSWNGSRVIVGVDNNAAVKKLIAVGDAEVADTGWIDAWASSNWRSDTNFLTKTRKVGRVVNIIIDLTARINLNISSESSAALVLYRINSQMTPSVWWQQPVHTVQGKQVFLKMLQDGGNGLAIRVWGENLTAGDRIMATITYMV